MFREISPVVHVPVGKLDILDLFLRVPDLLFALGDLFLGFLLPFLVLLFGVRKLLLIFPDLGFPVLKGLFLRLQFIPGGVDLRLAALDLLISCLQFLLAGVQLLLCILQLLLAIFQLFSSLFQTGA